MPFEPYPFWLKNPRKGRIPDRATVPHPEDESKTIATASRQSPRPKVLDAGPFGADIGSFALHLAAEGKAPSTIRNYTEAVRWFAGAHLLRQTCKTSWEVSRIASGASFGRSREHALPAAQRAALRRARGGDGPSGMRDL
jgi:hypothetical protein